MPKIKKLENQTQTHGKSSAPKTQPKTMEEIWGSTREKQSKFGTFNEEEYKEILSNYSRADLLNHARIVGVFPFDDMDRLKKDLLKAFRAYGMQFAIPEQPNNLSMDKISQDIKRILAEGK